MASQIDTETESSQLVIKDTEIKIIEYHYPPNWQRLLTLLLNVAF